MKVIKKQTDAIFGCTTYTFNTYHTYRVYDNGSEFVYTVFGLQPSASELNKMREMASTFEDNKTQIQD